MVPTFLFQAGESEVFLSFVRLRQLFTGKSLLVSGFGLSACLFYVFTYNSGYGYDALEYLIIGRAVSQGQPLYSLIPSKSPGIYYVTAAFLSVGLPSNHYTVSAIITLSFVATLVGTWWVIRRTLGSEIAIVSTLLVAACAVFMELNFLEPEGFVYLSGLAAFVLILQSLKVSKRLPVLAAGLCLAVGFEFKSVAAFYILGILSFMLFRQLRGEMEFRDSLRIGTLLVTGFLVATAIPILFFATTGRLTEFWTWTVAFPLFHYPANTFWLNKLVTKLLWFHLLLVMSLLYVVFVPRSRNLIWNNAPASLAFFMGLASYLALLKTQSSHYCFPGAGFFSIFISTVLVTAWKTQSSFVVLPRSLAFVVSVLLLALTISTLLYRPQAFQRLIKWQNFQEEELIASRLKQELAPGQRGLFVRNGTLLYWISGVESAARFTSFDVQATYFVEQHPDSLLKALNDQSTAMVEFNPLDPQFEDSRFTEFANKSGLLSEFKRILEKQYRPLTNSPAPFHFWLRKAGSEVD